MTIDIHHCPCGMPRTPEACQEAGMLFNSVKYEEDHMDLHLTTFPDASWPYFEGRVAKAKERAARQERWNVVHHVVVVQQVVV